MVHVRVVLTTEQIFFISVPAAPARARHGYLAPHILYCAHITISVVVAEAGGKAGAP